MKCLSKILLDAKHPRAYEILGDLMTRFKQIGPRITEFKASISFNTPRQKDWRYGSFHIIEKALKQMKNLKSLELDGEPYWICCNRKIYTDPYPLHEIEAIRGL
jgi:hypothetical protein